jgi:hypothetical protein
MIKDDLTLDGTPTLNLASFVTTYMVSSATPFEIEKQNRPHTPRYRDNQSQHQAHTRSDTY